MPMTAVHKSAARTSGPARERGQAQVCKDAAETHETPKTAR